MDDALLVSRARSGDLDAFGQLYDQYFPRIYDFSWRILRNSEEAADVTQDVFMKAMQNLPGLAKAARCAPAAMGSKRPLTSSSASNVPMEMPK